VIVIDVEEGDMEVGKVKLVSGRVRSCRVNG
jgi:hypothetical protein